MNFEHDRTKMNLQSYLHDNQKNRKLMMVVSRNISIITYNFLYKSEKKKTFILGDRSTNLRINIINFTPRLAYELDAVTIFPFSISLDELETHYKTNQSYHITLFSMF